MIKNTVGVAGSLDEAMVEAPGFSPKAGKSVQLLGTAVNTPPASVTNEPVAVDRTTGENTVVIAPLFKLKVMETISPHVHVCEAVEELPLSNTMEIVNASPTLKGGVSLPPPTVSEKVTT